ncbi:MAG: hypothetical protein ACR2JC_08305 [Chloroflexota bacterium]
MEEHAADRLDEFTELDLVDLAPDVSRASPHVFALALMFLAERGTRAGADLLATGIAHASTEQIDVLIRSVEIAQALAAKDPERLAGYIDAVEHHGLISDAARMRIVLAQMTNDPAPLTQARPVLERLRDRQFLRHLEEVATSLR